MRLIVDGRINADACNAFGIYILEKNLPEEYRQRLYNKLLVLCEKEAEFVMEDDLCLASFHPKFSKINGATVACINSIINIGDEEEPISYERRPIYVCLESDYDKVKHLDD